MKIKVSDLRSMIAEAVANPSEYTYVMDLTFGDDVERLKVPGVQFGTQRELQKSREERWKGLEEWKTKFFNRFGDLPLVNVKGFHFGYMILFTPLCDTYISSNLLYPYALFSF